MNVCPHFFHTTRKGLTLLILITFFSRSAVSDYVFELKTKFENKNSWKLEQKSAAGLKAKLDKLIERIDDEDGYGDLVKLSRDDDGDDESADAAQGQCCFARFNTDFHTMSKFRRRWWPAKTKRWSEGHGLNHPQNRPQSITKTDHQESPWAQNSFWGIESFTSDL